MVLSCYLDDSGGDPQNPITTLAGFVAKDDQWVSFENSVEKHFSNYGVQVLHAMDLYKTKGNFKNWSVLKKFFFVNRLCTEIKGISIQGLSISVLKTTYKARSEQYKRKRTITPYSYGFNVLLDWILNGTNTGRLAHSEGVALILETGHKNNAEAEWLFNDVREKHSLQNVLRSISFVGKKDCRAIQMADLIAFYSRKHGVACIKAQEKMQPQPIDPVMNLISGAVPVRSFVATDFGADHDLPFWRPPAS